MGEKYKLEIETIAKPRADYKTVTHRESGLPVAPAIMLSDEIIIQGCAISADELESAIRRHLGMV